MPGVRTFALICLFLAFAGNVFAQTSQVGGIVQDNTGALIPGVTITLTNTGTNVANTTLSNETSAYTFLAVQPGNYRLTAELSGFRQVRAEVQVGTNVQVRWNFTLEVGAVTRQVEVSVAPDQLLTESSSSVGVVLSERTVTDLPLVGENILDLLSVLPGFRESPVTDSHPRSAA